MYYNNNIMLNTWNSQVQNSREYSKEQKKKETIQFQITADLEGRL